MTPTFTFLATIAGLIMGSFLSMLIPRLHHGDHGIVLGRSKCMHCESTLRAWDLIPLFSYLLMGGKSRCCREKIILWYPAIELVTALSLGGLTLIFTDPAEWALHAFFFAVLIFIFFYDLRFQEIHDIVMIPAIILALIFNMWLGDMQSIAFGALFGFTFFALQYFLSKGRWVGAGDMRIGAFMGAMLGMELLPVALIGSYILGSMVSVYLIFVKKVGKRATIALGPFLSTGTVIAFFWGEQMINWYVNL